MSANTLVFIRIWSRGDRRVEASRVSGGRGGGHVSGVDQGESLSVQQDGD